VKVNAKLCRGLKVQNSAIDRGVGHSHCLSVATVVWVAHANREFFCVSFFDYVIDDELGNVFFWHVFERRNVAFIDAIFQSCFDLFIAAEVFPVDYCVEARQIASFHAWAFHTSDTTPLAPNVH